jgi:hypothetical protein
MAKQTINVGSTGNDNSGDTLRSGAIKINNNFSEVYNGLNGVLDKFQPGSHITLTKTAGVCTINAEIVPYTLIAANTGNLGGVKIPAVDTSGITNTSGTIGLATASATQLGGVKIDNSTITINGSGVIAAVAQVQSDWNAVSGLGVILNKPTIPSAYTLTAATTTTLGGVIVPAVDTSGITNTSGTIGLATASATQLGGVKIDNSTITIDQVTGVISSIGGVSGLTSRTVAAVTSVSLAAASSGTYTITGFKGYALLSVQTSSAAWVTVYSSSAAATADSERNITTDPVPGSGVIAEVITTSSIIQYFSPAVVGYNSEDTPTTAIPIKIYNNGSSTATITVTLTLIKLEA